MSTFIGGLDLGQQTDHSALVIVERCDVPDPDNASRTVNRFDVRHIQRWPLGTKYPRVVDDLKEWYGRHPLINTSLVVDATGVGRGVVDLVIESGIAANVVPMSITCGQKPGDGTVPKKDLVGAVQSALQTRRLRIAEELELTDALVKELEMFRVKVTSDRNETFAAWRERDHDDLVLALALAVWYGEEFGGGEGCYTPYSGRTPYDEIGRDRW